MQRVVLCENPKISVWLHPERGIIHHQMHGPCYGAEFRDALSAGTAAMRRHLATKWLSDDRAHVAMSPEDEAWARTTWFPEAQRAGWKHWALVQPVAIVGQMNLKRFTETYAQMGIDVRVFSEPEPALAWLQSI